MPAVQTFALTVWYIVIQLAIGWWFDSPPLAVVGAVGIAIVLASLIGPRLYRRTP